MDIINTEFFFSFEEQTFKIVELWFRQNCFADYSIFSTWKLHDNRVLNWKIISTYNDCRRIKDFDSHTSNNDKENDKFDNLIRLFSARFSFTSSFVLVFLEPIRLIKYSTTTLKISSTHHQDWENGSEISIIAKLIIIFFNIKLNRKHFQL